jgi:beta-glucosidase
MMESFKFPDGLLLGTSTSALQMEGGDKNNSWYKWANDGHTKDGTHPGIACGHWNRIDEDIELMKKLNCRIYRMGIEWSRIEPKKGVFNREAIAHYRDEIRKLIDNGIDPLVTLHHFSNPLWFDEAGGWVNPESIMLFERYAEYVVRNLGDIVTGWITINEPNVMLVNGYVYGIWPPGKKSIFDFFKAAGNVIRAHIRAYKKLHEIGLNMNAGDIKVGVANHIRLFEPKTKKLADKLVAKIYDYLFHDIFIRGMHEGKLSFPVGRGYPFGNGRYFDFFGINYYTRDTVSFVPDIKRLFGKMEVPEGCEKSDLGWEIYPEGLYMIVKKYHEKYNAAVYITENGIDTHDEDVRIKFMSDHLFQLKKLNDEGVEVKKYYYWTLIDNFEWLEGFQPKFGLIGMNLKSLDRKIKKSGMFFSDVSKEGEISEHLMDRYKNEPVVVKEIAQDIPKEKPPEQKKPVTKKKHEIEYFISEDD